MFSLNSVRVAPGVRSALAVACGVVLAVPAWGSEELEPLVVTARRAPQQLSRVLADVTVIGRETIERQAGGSVLDVLRSVSGVETNRTGGIASTSSVRLRGSDNRHVLVLIDGVPFDSQSSGGATWELIPLQHIDRIEVMRGTGSAVYGSDAVAGVIQIFTRRGEGPWRVELEMGAGDLRMARTDISVMGKQGMLDFALSAGAERHGGFNARKDAIPGTLMKDRDGHASNNLSVKVGAEPLAGHRLQFGVLNQHQNSRYDDAYVPDTDLHSIKDLRSSHASWTAQWASHWRSALTLGWSQDEYETRPDSYHTRTEMRTSSLINRLDVGDAAVMLLLERREDRLLNSGLTQSPSGNRGQRVDSAVGLGSDLRLGMVSLATNIRYDDDSEYGGQTTGTLSAGMQLTPHWRVRASTGTAFKAPTLYQRFSEYGNPNLVAEHSRNREVGLNYQAGSLSFGATVYENRLRNLIDYADPGVCASTYGCYRNVGVAKLKGVEMQAAFSVGSVRVSGSLDLAAPKNVETDRVLARRARRHANLRVETPMAGWLWGVQANAYSERPEFTGDTLAGYTLWTADVSGEMTRSWRWLLRVDNLTDKRYEEAKSYAVGPRTVFIGVRWTPGS